MAKSYGKRPSEILFPHNTSPLFTLAVDNVVFLSGDAQEVQAEIEFEQAKMKYYTELLTACMKALSGVR